MPILQSTQVTASQCTALYFQDVVRIELTTNALETRCMCLVPRLLLDTEAVVMMPHSADSTFLSLSSSWYL